MTCSVTINISSAFGGSKDSSTSFLYLLNHGIPIDRIELWHKEVDGRENTFFDWEVTPGYCRQFAEAFHVPIYYQWKEGGFYREMKHDNSRTAPNCFECPDGKINKVGGKRGKLNTRFRNTRTLVISRERGEESAARANYAVFEPDRADRREGKQFIRHVDRFRPLRDWKEQQVWEIIERYRVRVHPCYYMGWSRCSCKSCVFSNKNQFAGANFISPLQMEKVVSMEKQFCWTMKRNTDLPSLTATGTPYKTITEELKQLVTSYSAD